MSSSMLYTMGMALDRAAESGFTVRVLVDGSWIEGVVAASDGTGVVLESAEGRHSVVKTDRISAVTVCADLPGRMPISVGAGEDGRGWDAGETPRPMPGPRTAD